MYNQKRFSNRVLVGLSSFLYDCLSIVEVRHNIEEIVRIPFFIAESGEEQFMKDLFLDHDKYKNELSCKVDGTVNQVPRGVIKMLSPSVLSSDMPNHYNKMVYNKVVDGEFSKEIRNFVSLGHYRPMLYNFEITIRCSNHDQRLNIFDNIIDQLTYSRYFYFSYDGFPKLKAQIKFPDDYSVDREYKISFSNNPKPELSFNLELRCYKPIIDERSEYHLNNTIKKSQVAYVEKNRIQSGEDS
jgi:hypothetical protein